MTILRIVMYNPSMAPAKAMLCILALLSLAESSTPLSLQPLANALANARMVEPDVVARVLTEVVRIDPTSAQGEWLADLRGFDASEWQELSNLMRAEGVGLGDRSKLRRLATAVTQLATMEDDFVGSDQGDDGSGLSYESASPKICYASSQLHPQI
jgi:hypothetical protein